jgi:hypothetical protein
LAAVAYTEFKTFSITLSGYGVTFANDQVLPVKGFWSVIHANSSHSLLPSPFRGFEDRNPGQGWQRIWNTESDLFWEFYARARELYDSIQDDWGILFAMQHYGTPTRLLHWTEVLGIALYFAVLGVDELREKDELDISSAT